MENNNEETSFAKGMRETWEAEQQKKQEQMIPFTQWFNQKLKIGRYPTPAEIDKSDFDYIINVSDEFIPSCAQAAMHAHKKYFWFPMNECVGDMGLNSLFAAMQILWIAEQEQAKVYLHCHAGVNRSQTTGDAYFFMRTGSHRARRKQLNELNEQVEISCAIQLSEDSRSSNNRFISNVESGHLPAKRRIEQFLTMLPSVFKKDDSMRGGHLDDCKDKSKM